MKSARNTFSVGRTRRRLLSAKHAIFQCRGLEMSGKFSRLSKANLFCVEERCVRWSELLFAISLSKLNFLLNLFRFIWGNDRTSTKIRKSVDLAWNVNKCISICSAMQWTSVFQCKNSVTRNRRKIVLHNSAESKAYSINLQFECESAESVQLCRVKSVFSASWAYWMTTEAAQLGDGHLRWFAVAKRWIFLHGNENALQLFVNLNLKKAAAEMAHE